jgi:folate-dependent phosphoribosylglycinamide formyltransferase PurN
LGPRLKVVLYTFESPVTLAIADRLIATGKISAVILQTPMTWRNKAAFLRRRFERYGLWRVVDEILFKLFYTLFLKRADDRLRLTLAFDRSVSKERLERQIDLHHTESLNRTSGRDLLRRLEPDLVIMMSREMIHGETLGAARLGFVGCHPGLLPEYRGVYAPFWAMAAGRPDQVGLSVYLANSGVDTGPLVSERALAPRFGLRHFKVESERLMLEGVSDLIAAVEQAERGRLTTYTKPEAESRLYSHIGLTHYLAALRRDGVRPPSR